jgi:hypothetical protein
MISVAHETGMFKSDPLLTRFEISTVEGKCGMK